MFVLSGFDAVNYFYRKSKKAILERVLKLERVLSFYQILESIPISRRF